MKDYVHAVRNYPWLFDAIESAVAVSPDEALSDGYRLFRGLQTSTGRPIADSEALVALNALCDLGVVKRRGARYDLDKQRWHESEQLREGIKSAIAILGNESHSTCAGAHLCVSLPPTFAPAAEHVIRESSTDLRSGVLDVIVGAQHSLLIASPFWDAGTSEEIADLAKKRLGGGVSVTILADSARTCLFQSVLNFGRSPTTPTARFCPGSKGLETTPRPSTSKPSPQIVAREPT